MSIPTSTSAAFPFRAASPSGMSAELNANGSIRRMDCGDVMLNAFLGNEAEGGPANIHLRRHGRTMAATPLLGPASPSSYQVSDRGMTAAGSWGELTYRVRLVLAESEKAWFWHVELENTGSEPVRCDLIHTQDIAIAHYGAIRLNEYYVSQYVDHTPLDHPAAGVAVASRQNQSMGGSFPWTVIGSLGKAVSYATDALQFHHLATRAGGEPTALTSGLPGTRLQHEHSMVAIQDEVLVLEPGEKSQRGFFGCFLPDKSTATSADDLGRVAAALALPEAACPPWPSLTAARPAPSLFTTAGFLETENLTDKETTSHFGSAQLHQEHGDGRPWSFFTAHGSHVVLKDKELAVLRPHGHILRTGGSLTPDESALTSTAWMGGVFHSMVTQGHVSINRFLSTCHSYLGLFRSHGQRVFVEVDGAWKLLGMPSAFEMTPDTCRWIYKHGGGVIEVVSTAPASSHELVLTLAVRQGDPVRFLISHHIAINGDDGSASIPVRHELDDNLVYVSAIPDSDVGRRFPEGGFVIEASGDTQVQDITGDEALFEDGLSRDQPFLCFLTAPVTAATLMMRGRLVDSASVQIDEFWKTVGADLKINAPPSSSLAPAAARTSGIFPWFVHNALIHYLSPRGLEQYSGGGWGTRDVCQGPLELLMALGRFDSIRDLLCRVFRQQNADGDWPQWFMFFERERNIRPGDSHGDIVYWPLLALAQYLTATGDASLLEEPLPFFHPDGDDQAETASIGAHVERALDLIRRRVVKGTHLAAYGHGDWNDSLQPAKPDMREHLCSSWTVTLNYQTFIALAAAYNHLGKTDRAAEFEAMAAKILTEFQSVLVVDDILAGLAYFHENGKTQYLLHPQDDTTGLSYSLLPMIHAIINDMFSPAQAAAHLGLIRKHLLGPDGARLFDRPLAYHGGLQTYFQRAESASYFGREIGIMYTHAHLRYCEALARFGDAEGFFHALSQFNPIAIRELVTTAAPRQANCYYSSSDAAFADRYQAYAEYDRVNNGEIPLEGGWRVYSSGAGIGARLIMQCFLGLTETTSSILIDPVIPSSLDGMSASLLLTGHLITVTYQIKSTGCGPLSVQLNGKKLAFTRENNPYRTGAARITMEDFIQGLAEQDNQLTISLE